ncbi:MAG: hypothetical protein ACR2FL_08610 [Nocardioidaceae bacterium]
MCSEMSHKKPEERRDERDRHEHARQCGPAGQPAARPDLVGEVAEPGDLAGAVQVRDTEQGRAHQGSGGAEAEDLADGGPAGRWGRVG